MFKFQLFFAAVIPILSLNVSAQLVASDFLAKGDHLIIQDTTTGLYWLKPTYVSAATDFNALIKTTYSAVEARTQTPSDILYGFRHATATEVTLLLGEANVLLTNSNSYFKVPPAIVSQYQAFFALFGTTYQSIQYTGNGVVALNAYTSSTCGQIKNAQKCFASYDNYNYISTISLNTSMSPNGVVGDVFATVKAPTNYNYYTGHFLVSSVNPSKIN